ncbi:MAG: hypothetical protein ABSG53_07095 [Thermoguttaceae bacterium]|jgi:hypothetical protein
MVYLDPHAIYAHGLSPNDVATAVGNQNLIIPAGTAKVVFDRNIMPVMVPAAALATRSGTPRVALLDGEHHVHYRSVQLGRDFGAEIAVIVQEGQGDPLAPQDPQPVVDFILENTR